MDHLEHERPAIEKPGEMAAILNNLQEGDVLFVLTPISFAIIPQSVVFPNPGGP